MIKDNKKLNPFLGVVIGFVFIFSGIFIAQSIVSDNLSFYLSLIIMTPIFTVGSIFLKLNASFLGFQMLAKKLDKNAEIMNPITYLDNTSIIMKVRDLYIVKNINNCLHILQMNEKEISSVSWIRRMFLGPKLPIYNPKASPVITEYDGFEIRKRLGKPKLYDIEENQWITGHATIFIIFPMLPFKKKLHNLLTPEKFQDLTNIIEKINLIDAI